MCAKKDLFFGWVCVFGLAHVCATPTPRPGHVLLRGPGADTDKQEKIWFHVDGKAGAGVYSPETTQRLMKVDQLSTGGECEWIAFHHQASHSWQIFLRPFFLVGPVFHYRVDVWFFSENKLFDGGCHAFRAWFSDQGCFVTTPSNGLGSWPRIGFLSDHNLHHLGSWLPLPLSFLSCLPLMYSPSSPQRKLASTNFPGRGW